MRAVVQRVSGASVACEGHAVARIGRGLVVLACIEADDAAGQRGWMADKLCNLRVFPDDAGKMNLSVKDVGGSILLISNFTVAGDCRSGRRPGFERAMKPPQAKDEFDLLIETVRAQGVPVETGVFGGDMEVTLVNDGPVTLIVETSPAG